MNLIEIELELKKRLSYPYLWGRKQNNYYNGQTNFIYEIKSFEKLLEEINIRFKGKNDYNNFFNYALNRWYNYWSARAAEDIFCSLPNIVPAKNERDRLVDFSIYGINFDHKSSVFPKGYDGTFEDALKNPGDLCEWLYENQSQEQRKHLKNRLFIILYSPQGNHWKLKAEISLIKTRIEGYVNNFNKDKLIKISLEKDSITLSDIIWVVK